MPMILEGPARGGNSSRRNCNLRKAAQRSLGVVMSPLRDPDAPKAVRGRLHVRCTRVPPIMMAKLGYRLSRHRGSHLHVVRVDLVHRKGGDRCDADAADSARSWLSYIALELSPLPSVAACPLQVGPSRTAQICPGRASRYGSRLPLISSLLKLQSASPRQSSISSGSYEIMTGLKLYTRDVLGIAILDGVCHLRQRMARNTRSA
jgi:hypothetical protein